MASRIPFDATFDPDSAEIFRQEGGFNRPSPIAGLIPPAVPQDDSITPDTIGFNQVTNKVRVNGFEFDADDSQSALDSLRELVPEKGMVPLTEGFTALTAGEFTKYIQDIKNPSYGTLAKRNFGIGADNLQLLFGRGLQFLGAEEIGQTIVDQQIKDLRRNQPFQRQFTDIELGSETRGPLAWFIANLAQQGPNLIESALVAIAGAGLGAIAGGGANPFSALGGLFVAFAGRAKVKQEILRVAAKYNAGTALTVQEAKLLREVASGAAAAKIRQSTTAAGIQSGLAESAQAIAAAGRTQAVVGGAGGASVLGNLAFGVADLTGEQAEAGKRDRATALALAVPYALFESLPEFAALGFFVRGRRLARGGKLKKARSRLKSAAIGGSAGAVLEGVTEAGQESLLLSENEQVDLLSREGFLRLVNSFAAGAGVGGTLGTVAGGLRRQASEPISTDTQTDLLQIEGRGEQQLLPPPREPGPLGPINLLPDRRDRQFDLDLEGGQGFARQGGEQLDLNLPEPIDPRQGDLGLSGTAQVAGVPVVDDVVIPPTQPGPQGDLFAETPDGPVANEIPFNPAVGDALSAALAPQQPQQPRQAVESDVLAPEVPQQPSRLDRAAQQVIDPRQEPFQQALGQVQEQDFQQVLDSMRQGELDVAEGTADIPAGFPAFNAPGARGFGTVSSPITTVSGVDANGDPILRNTTVKKALQDARTRLVDAVTKFNRIRKFGTKLANERRSEVIDAEENLANVITSIQRAYPGLINDEGFTQEEIAEQQAALTSIDDSQISLPFTEEGDVEADVIAARNVRAFAKKDLKRGKSKKVPRRSESGSRAISAKGKPRSTRKTQAGSAAIKSAAARSRARKPPSGKKAGKSKPTRQEQQDEVIGAREQPAALKLFASLGEFNSPEDVVTATKSAAEALTVFIAVIESNTGGVQEFTDAATGILQLALFRGSDSESMAHREARKIAYELDGESSLLFGTEDNRRLAEDAFLELVSERAPAKYTKRKDVLTDWAQYALDRGLAYRMHEMIETAPTDATSELTVAIGAAININDDVLQQITNAEANELISLLDRIDRELASLGPHVRGHVADNVAAFNRQSHEIVKLRDKKPDLSQLYRGHPLSAWLDKDGNILWNEDRNAFTIAVPVATDTHQQAEASTSEKLKDADKPIKRDQTKKVDREGAPSLNEGGPIRKAMSNGAVREFVRIKMRKFQNAARPKVVIFKSVDELKRKRPQLFNEAMTSRNDKTPVPSNAAGYAFGRTIIIFSDNIKHKKHLAFVLAHEVIGHFGLASIMPKADHAKLMDDIYNQDSAIRAEADRRTETLGTEKREATEEALADLAAEIDNSIILRVWQPIKRFLQRVLGLNPEDDLARYYVYQSRRYAMTGTTGDVSAEAVHANLQELQARYIEGRASETLYGQASFQQSLVSGLSGFEAFRATIDRVIKHRDGSPSGIRQTIRGAAAVVGRGLEELQSLDQLALRSPGLKKLFDIFTKQVEHIRKTATILNDLTRFSTRMNFFDRKPRDENDFNRGATKAERVTASRVMHDIRVFLSRSVTDSLLRDVGKIIILKDGVPRVSKATMDAIRAHTNVTKSQVEKGLVVQKTDNLGRDAIKRNANDEPVGRDGKVLVPDANGNLTGVVKLMQRSEVGVISNREWKIVQEQRAAVVRAAQQVVMDKVLGILQNKNDALKIIQDKSQGKLSAAEMEVLGEIQNLYAARVERALGFDGTTVKWNKAKMADADNLLRELTRSMWNNDKLNDWVKGNSKPRVDAQGKPVLDSEGNEQFEASERFRKQDDVKKIIPKLAALHAAGISQNMADEINNTLKDLQLLDNMVENEELYAKRTILSSYAPFRRDGKFQVRVQAYIADNKGNATTTPVKLHETVEAMLFFGMTDGGNEARSQLAALTEMFEKMGSVKTRSRAGPDGHGEDVTVVFVPEMSLAAKMPPLGGTLDYAEVAATLVRLGIDLSPENRETLVQYTAALSSKARNNLFRSGNPGFNLDLIRETARHLEAQTHIAGKNRFRYQVDNVMADTAGGLWAGDATLLRNLQSQFVRARAVVASEDTPKNRALEFAAYRALSAYQHMFRNSAAVKDKPWITMLGRDGAKSVVNGGGRSGQYLDKARQLVDFYNTTGNVADATGEERFGRFAGPIMSTVAAAQLGGALAPALVNMTSLVSHTPAYLATFNKKTGYGGGFGMGAATAATFKAARDLNLLKAFIPNEEGNFVDDSGSAQTLQNLLDKGDTALAKAGLDRSEAEFLLDLTAKGVLTPNMFNALVGTSRAGRNNPSGRVIEGWMIMFAKTEQYNRRVTALASYRLEKNRLLESGTNLSVIDNKNSLVAEKLRERATLAVNASQGNYSQFNRPHLARGNILQYAFMYKQFVIITVQLLRNLAPAHQILFLSLLIFMSGLKGIPFSEDMIDIVDTVAQKLEIKTAGIETEFILFLSSYVGAPVTQVMMRGVLDYYLGVTLSTRLGHGDLVPGTGMFKAGSDAGREFVNILGPVASTIIQAGGTVALLAQFLTEAMGLQDDRVSLSDVGREGFGVTAFKSVFEGYRYASDGQITNNRGQVVSQSATVMDVVFRLMGFYPGSATTHNQITRLSKAAASFSKEMKASYMDAYRKSDATDRRQILQDVRDWNRDARGTPFFIRNFVSSARKSVREAERTTSARFLKSAPRDIRPLQIELMKIFGFDHRGVPFAD